MNNISYTLFKVNILKLKLIKSLSFINSYKYNYK
jgi:hypothetical protein